MFEEKNVESDTPEGGDSPRLTEAERTELLRLEEEIRRGLKVAFATGAAIKIRDARLYREKFETFEEYVLQIFDLSRAYAYQLMDAATVYESIKAASGVVPSNEFSCVRWQSCRPKSRHRLGPQR